MLVLAMTSLCCHPLPLFTFGMANLVFWILTCFQCPFPCQQYKGNLATSPDYQPPVAGICNTDLAVVCQDIFLLWVWPALSITALVIIVTTPTQPQFNSKVGFDTKRTLDHHHPPPPPTTTTNSMSSISQLFLTQF